MERKSETRKFEAYPVYSKSWERYTEFRILEKGDTFYSRTFSTASFKTREEAIAEIKRFLASNTFGIWNTDNTEVA